VYLTLDNNDVPYILYLYDDEYRGKYDDEYRGKYYDEYRSKDTKGIKRRSVVYRLID